ncbi:MAG: carboxypeptidase-like regulatory domain-containing protein, partial [Anaerolineae bacterium]
MKGRRWSLIVGVLLACLVGLERLPADASADGSRPRRVPDRGAAIDVDPEPGVRCSGGSAHPFMAPAKSPTVFTVTVSGTVTGPDGPVPDVAINVNAGASGLPYSEDAVTDGNGLYSVTIQTDGILNLHARPPIASRLAEVNMQRHGITGSFTHNFTTPAGYLLSLRPADEAGHPLEMVDWQLLAYSLLTPPPPGHVPEYHLMWDEALERYECVVPPDVYTVVVDNPPTGTLQTTTIFDMRYGDQLVDLVFSRSSSNPTISYPPDASKITVGSPDGLGEALVTGAPGAVVPTGYVMLTNLSSWHLVSAVSNPDGSFEARIYAPPGSALYVQHGPLQWLSRLADTSEVYDVFPGALINLPHTHSADAGALEFAAAGAVAHVPESGAVAPHVTAAWAITGTVRPGPGSGTSTAPSMDRYAPGDWFRATGTLRIYGHGITATTDLSGISASGGVDLRMLGNGDGVPLVPYNAALTTRLTVSGFPIRDGYENAVGMGCGFEVNGLHLGGDHAVEGSFSVDCQVPDDAPPGTYRPVIGLDFSGVPVSSQWLAPNTDISYRNYRLNEAPLPPIVVAEEGQSVAEVRQLWRLMMEDNSQGTRGAGAREDADRAGFLSFIAMQGAPYVAPPVNARDGTPIVYSLEPALPMLTSNVSTLYIPPSPPLVPFSLPGGSLSAVILRPDRTTLDLGSEGFEQSAMRARTTRGGFPLNTGTTRVDHDYSLIAASDRFRLAFDQYGHHVITVTGQVSDLWGNRYTGGGTYDVWVGEPLDMATGVLPGTPFDVGDAFNPALQLYPGVPARVEWVVTEYPDSDPARAIRHTASGWANRFGNFDGRGFAFSAPGEYRVDVVARYVDEAGVMWMGARTWGGVVMTPAAQAQLMAHGRRGINNLVHIPGPWFVFCRDLAPIPGATPHTFAPYFNGDVLWSRLEPIYECSGEALLTGGSVQDTVGVWEARMRERAERMSPPLDPPGDLDERVSSGEIPLLSSTRSGRPPQIVPEEIDQIAYMYFYSERPGLRVREDITEDYTFPAGYWRFETLYDDQMGVGLLGDLPNDYKF